MGTAEVHAAPAEPQGKLSAYKIVTHGTLHLEAGDLRGLVYSKWLRSLRYENDYFRLIEAEAYWKTYSAYITAILAKPETKLRLAVLVDAPDVVLGFSVSRAAVLDYVWVQKRLRRLGIAKRLVPEGITTISHLTKAGLAIWGTKHNDDWKFNPFA